MSPQAVLKINQVKNAFCIYGMNQLLDVAANRNFSQGFRKSFCSNAGQNLFGLFDPLDGIRDYKIIVFFCCTELLSLIVFLLC